MKRQKSNQTFLKWVFTKPAFCDGARGHILCPVVNRKSEKQTNAPYLRCANFPVTQLNCVLDVTFTAFLMHFFANICPGTRSWMDLERLGVQCTSRTLRHRLQGNRDCTTFFFSGVSFGNYPLFYHLSFVSVSPSSELSARRRFLKLSIISSFLQTVNLCPRRPVCQTRLFVHPPTSQGHDESVRELIIKMELAGRERVRLMKPYKFKYNKATNTSTTWILFLLMKVMMLQKITLDLDR